MLSTVIPTSAALVGDFTTKQQFKTIAVGGGFDTTGTLIADTTNFRLNVIAGYKYCRVGYSIAFATPSIWAALTTYTLGQIRKPVAGGNYFYIVTTAGTSGISEPAWGTTVGGTTADGTVVWTCHSVTEGVGWRGCRIKNSAGSNYGNQRMGAVSEGATTNASYMTPWLEIAANSAPNKIAVGDYFDFWPAHTFGDDLASAADTASSWVSIEFSG